MVSVALTPKRACLDCQRERVTLPWLSPGTLALCSSDFPLAPEKGSSGHPQLTVVQFACQRAWITEDPVPRGRFELPRGYPHYALNVARLPVPPHRPVVPASLLGADLRTRTADLLFTKQLLYQLS